MTTILTDEHSVGWYPCAEYLADMDDNDRKRLARIVGEFGNDDVFLSLWSDTCMFALNRRTGRVAISHYMGQCENGCCYLWTKWQRCSIPVLQDASREIH